MFEQLQILVRCVRLCQSCDHTCRLTLWCSNPFVYDVFEQLKDDVRSIYTGHMYMNIIKYFVWMDRWVDGCMGRWMDGWTDQSKVPLRISLCVVQLETWHHTHRKIALSIFVYSSLPPTPLPFAADGTISLFCTTIILPPYLS